MGDTALGRRLEIRKRELSASVNKMSVDKRSSMRMKLDERDVREAETTALAAV